MLTLGPPALVGGVYALCFPAQIRQIPVWGSVAAADAVQGAGAGGLDAATLTPACNMAADELLKKLPATCRILVRPPFVLAGDFSEAELDRLYRDAVLPVTRALWRSYFDHKPDAPVTIVVLRSEESYHAAAAALDGYEPVAYAGYTQRGKRRVVLNLATGQGTLAHELSHVLASFDFPDLPEWFDEGLAALYEDAVFSEDGLLLVGTSNWRLRILQDTLRQRVMPSLAAVVNSPEFRGEGEGLNYAVVRCFCQYLQERGLLAHFYRKFRSAIGDDLNGIATLCDLLGVASIEDIDRDFRTWVSQFDAR